MQFYWYILFVIVFVNILLVFLTIDTYIRRGQNTNGFNYLHDYVAIVLILAAFCVLGFAFWYTFSLSVKAY